jgi:hypothetical protein
VGKSIYHFNSKNYFIMTPMTLQLADYGISSKTGFLPERPVSSTAIYNQAWHQLAANLPKALATGSLKTTIEALPEFVEDVETARFRT